MALFARKMGVLEKVRTGDREMKIRWPNWEGTTLLPKISVPKCEYKKNF